MRNPCNNLQDSISWYLIESSKIEQKKQQKFIVLIIIEYYIYDLS